MNKLTHAELEERRQRSAGEPRVPITVVVHNVRSLYNVGSIFRTSDAVRIEELILTGFTPHPPRKEIDKTALGATATVPNRYEKNIIDVLQTERKRGSSIVALEQTRESIPVREFSPTGNHLTLVIGNELIGITNDVLEHCDAAVEIPMAGEKHSLNVAVAYGIAVYELAEKLKQ